MPFCDLREEGRGIGESRSSSVNPSFVAHVFTLASKTEQKHPPPSFLWTASNPAEGRGKAVEGSKGRVFWYQAGKEGRAGASEPISPPASESFKCPELPWVSLLVCCWESQSRSEVWPQLVLRRLAQAGTVWFRGNPSPYRRVS
jgi:hypothetical protein